MVSTLVPTAPKDEFGRFEYGIPPARNGDYAFLLHLIASLKSKGKGAIILPHGVLFRGNKEADIRRNLIRRGFIKGIIGLPANLFFGTGIPACVVVLDKENAHARTSIFMIDASKGFMKDGAKNRLREQDIHRIVDVFTRQTEVARYARMVPVAEIADPANDYNINIPRYIDSSEPEDLHDLEAHLRGGIPNRDIDDLQAYWDVFPSLRAALFTDSGRASYSVPRIEPGEVKTAILGHEEFQSYADRVRNALTGWCAAHQNRLLNIDAATAPKSLVVDLSEDLLGRFRDLPLLDAYNVYQCLRDYWEEAMQDDIYLIVGEGWFRAGQPRGIVQDRKRNVKEAPDLIVKRRKYKLDLVPPALIIARYFATEQRAVESEVQRLIQSLAARIQEIAERYARPLPKLEQDVEAFSTKVEQHLTRMGVAP